MNTREDFKNEDETHIKYSFRKVEKLEENINKKNIKYNLDFINQELEKENLNININSHIIEKFNKILNNYNKNIIFFPWQVTESINSNLNKKIYGLYPYIIRLESPKPSKNIIQELLHNSSTIEISQHKLTNKTLVIISLSFDKSSFFPFNNIIYKYEIFINEDNPQINWIGGKKYVIMNCSETEDNNIFECKFCFLTTLKGLIEVNRISVLFYKKGDNLEGIEETILIKHITKPLSIDI